MSYRVPTMKEVAKLRGSSGLKMVSTFSGCGGACLGYEMAGFQPLYANEFIEEARATYSANHPGVFLDGRDIREVSGEEILEIIKLKRGELDFLEGSPPCSPFSTAGLLNKGWGKVKSYSDKSQRSDDLFFEFSRLVGELSPKVFAAENVTGLVKGKAIGYFREIIRDLRDKGYQVSSAVLDASYLGVPQARKRVIFLGVRNDLVEKFGVSPIFPKPRTPRYSISEAIANLPGAEKRGATYFDLETDSEIGLERYAVGAEWERTPIGGSSEKYFQLVRPNPNLPSPTITATTGVVGAASVVHPIEKRKFTVAELRALSSFPEDFILTGNYSQRVERLGRSVPPLMSKAIGETIRDEIFRRINA